ncbi:protein MIS12 homolog [Mastacembelus armatus]|uniref:Protein MIS12 homolog n=1 Tax=Mastacembelus armatus TaxID=205130 RepID=A0A7N8YHX5_9TELE|nr:protein MIS12 homolog [Mastacembelus armatus]
MMAVCGEVGEEADRFSLSSLRLYEAQFFGFTPKTCMLRVNSVFNDCLCDILPVVENVCVSQLSKGESEETVELLRSRARECSRKLQEFLGERFKQMSKRMEMLLVDRCLSVPPNVLLPEDQAHKTYPHDAEEVLRLESSLVDLQRACEAEVYAQQALLAELKLQKEVQKQLDGVLIWVRELQNAWVKEGNGNFLESFRLVMESLTKLQETGQEVCNKVSY